MMPGGIHPPLEVIATWPKPDYVDTVKHSHATVGILAVLGPLTVGTVVARTWARAVIQRKAGLDDWLMLASLVPTIGFLIGVGIANEKLFDRHIWDDKPSEWVSQRKITWANELTYVLSGGIIKISVLLFYRRMAFRTVSRIFTIATIVSLISVLLFTAGFLLAIFLSCRPLNAFWDQLDLTKMRAGFSYECYNEPAHLMAASIISTIQDFVAASLPAILCWNLQISLREKVALYACFGVGYIVCIFSAVRCYTIYHIFYNTYDVPWFTWYTWILSALEVGLGTICASVPALKVFVKHLHDKIPLSGGSSTMQKVSRRSAPVEMVKSGARFGLHGYGSSGA